MTINAVYEQGVFKPTTAIELKEGTQVEVLIKEEIAGPDPREAARLLEEIAHADAKSRRFLGSRS